MWTAVGVDAKQLRASQDGPGRLAVPPALDAPEASLCLEEGNWECSPVPPLSELFLTLTLPSHPSGQCPSLHPCPLNSSPHPRLF